MVLYIQWNSEAGYNMVEPWKHCAKWSKPEAKWEILYDSLYMRYLE